MEFYILAIHLSTHNSHISMSNNSFFAFLFSLFAFSGQPFEIVNTTAQIQINGRQESGQTTTFYVKLCANKSSEKLDIIQLYLDNITCDATILDCNKEPINSFEKNDTIIIAGSFRNIQTPTPGTTSINLSYKKGHKFDVERIYYYSIEKIYLK